MRPNETIVSRLNWNIGVRELGINDRGIVELATRKEKGKEGRMEEQKDFLL